MEDYPKELFDLFITFANKYSELNGIDIFESIKQVTPIYFLIGNFSWEFDENSKFWNELKSVTNITEIADKAYELYINKREREINNLKWTGCFRYKHTIDKNTGDEIIKLHFLNNDKSGYGPLSNERKEVRLSELKELFTDVKNIHPNVKRVLGGSWLYNIENYTRLFPKTYTENMRSIKPKPQYLVIWGQFIDSEWKLKKEITSEFVKNIANVKTSDELFNSFKYKELFPEGDIKDFYNFYDINNVTI